MYSTVYSGGIDGSVCYPARIEVDISRALPSFDMVGRLSREVTEARERVQVALRNSGIELPPSHITINISPANIRKTGTAYDLPIAIGILAAQGYIPESRLDKICIIGELGLDGSVCPVHGILPIINDAVNHGFAYCMVPYSNAKEASFIESITVIGVSTFAEAVKVLTEKSSNYIIPPANISDLLGASICTDDFSDVIGQDACKRAALIAASGFHHLLITGPPGSGKSMIAKRMISIMPPLTSEESLEVSSIYSIAGLLDDKKPIVTMRPFQSPHHASTLHALTGGGPHIRPGAISLSHKGILFLDELPEFSKECIESLREPIENRRIQISRVNGTYTYPADFLLVAASNPCPCGYYPDRNRCNCTEPEIRRYQNKISGPIRDRIDLIVTSEKLEINNLISNATGTNSKSMRNIVMSAHAIQRERYHDTDYSFNSQVSSQDINRFFPLSKDAKDFMADAFSAMNLSARSYHKVLKVARTIADIDNRDTIDIPHLAEAICFRG